MTYQLVLLRHGESQWNLENRFSGWKDVDLTETGVAEAKKAAALLAAAGLQPEFAFTSVLKRAIRTLWIALIAVLLLVIGGVALYRHWQHRARERIRIHPG